MSEQRVERITKVIVPDPNCSKGYQPQNAIPPGQRIPPGGSGVSHTPSAESNSSATQGNAEPTKQG